MISPNAPIVTIFGGSGFVGRYIARRMAKAGWRVRVAVRRPNEALFVQTYGVVGQVRPILANIRNEDSVGAAVAGADAVVNCVGILAPTGKQSFEAVQDEGAGCVARAAMDAGSKSLVHISAIGADAESESRYARSKAMGEAKVQEAFPTATILRPSIVFGTEDAFFNRFAGMARISPVIPLVGAETRFQPVFVDDVAAAAEAALGSETTGGVYELGGPDTASFHDLIRMMLDIIQRKRLILPLPFWLGQLQGSINDIAVTLSGGLIPSIISSDQVTLLRSNNVVNEGARTLADLGIAPTPMRAELEDYLYCFRPSGQYAEITASAKHLRD